MATAVMWEHCTKITHFIIGEGDGGVYPSSETMASQGNDVSNELAEDDNEEIIEERKEFVENPDGSYTIRTIKTITKTVEGDEEEEEEEEIEETEKDRVKEDGRKEKKTTTTEEDDDAKFGTDGLAQLTQEEVEELMLLQAERQWLDKMGSGGVGVEQEVEESAAKEEEEDDSDKAKKKKKRPEGEKKGKKKKKRSDGKENKRDALIQRDILAKHVGPRVRSFDSAKMKTKFEKPKEQMQVPSTCRACSKQVFQMEKIVAERAAWHKNCFRCTQCDKTLTLETYQSHEGALYCKPHFKELFRPKAVVEDPAEARKERLLRRPKMIVLESNPEVLPDDVVRATSKPDYGLEELASLNVKQRFSMFESAGQEEEPKLEPVSVRRSQSMINRAARFLAENGDKEYGVDSYELGEYEEDQEEVEEEEEEEEEVEEEDGVDEEGEPIIVKTIRKKRKIRPKTITNAGNLKDMLEKKTRREEMTKMRKEELGRFRQMLCAGKNISLKEMFESGKFENDEKKNKNKEEIHIDEKRAARSLKEKFERGQPFILDDEDGESESHKHSGEIQEVEEVFKDAETASRARNLFKQIDSKVNQDGSAAIMRSQSFATGAKDNRRSMDGLITEDVEVGRDPNLIRCTDNYQDEVDCRNTKSILNMFKKMEAKSTGAVDDDEEQDTGPRPLHRFTPPPEGEGEYDDEYSDEDEYTDDEEYSGDEGEEEEENGDGDNGKAQYKDELLQMSAKKAAQLRAKFEKWEAEVDRQNDLNKGGTRPGLEDDEEAMPSLDTARNLKAMFEEKAQEAAKPQVRERVKVNRFVGGGGDVCPACNKTVYAMEKFEVQGKIIHKTCFKCCKCNSPLSMVTFTMGGGKLYCNSHYKQLFTEKGNYDSILSGAGAAPAQQ